MAYTTKEELSSAVEEMKSMIDEIKAMVSPKEEMSDDDVELSKNMKEQLSAPAADPIKHSPESESNKVNQKVFAKSNVRTTLDRVLNKLNK